MTVPTEAPETCLIFNGKRLTVLTEASGKRSVYYSWQDNDSSDRSIISLASV